jgi:hypothetical protein
MCYPRVSEINRIIHSYIKDLVRVSSRVERPTLGS